MVLNKLKWVKNKIKANAKKNKKWGVCGNRKKLKTMRCLRELPSKLRKYEMKLNPCSS